MHDVAGPTTEDRVKLVLATERKTRVAAVLVTGESVSKIPAPRTLTHIAGKRADVADLRCCDCLGGFRKNSILPPNEVIAAQRIQSDESADRRAAIPRLHLIKTFDRLEIHEHVGRRNTFFH